MTFWQNIFFAFWFFLPAGIANIFASLSGVVPKIREYDFPMDFYLTLGKHRILGPHKTIRGLIIGVIAAMAAAFFEGSPIWLGFLLGTGAILGDAVKSFVKRQLDIPSGESFLFFDQIDYIVGGILFSVFYVQLDFMQYSFIAVLFFGLHLIVNVIGYKLGLKQKAY